jgi:hypothetical protein
MNGRNDESDDAIAVEGMTRGRLTHPANLTSSN